MPLLQFLRCFYSIVLAGIVLCGAGCATKQVNRAYEEALAHRSSPPALASDAEVPPGPPYQLMLVLDRTFLERMVTKALKENLLEGVEFSLPGYTPPGGTGPLPRGGGFFARRLRGMGRSLLESLSPGVRLEDVALAFEGVCADCLQLRLGVWTGFQNEDGSPGPGLRGFMTLGGRIEVAGRERTSLSVVFERLDTLHLRASADLPPMIRGLLPTFEEALTLLARDLLEKHWDRLRFDIPVAEKVTLGYGVRVRRVGARGNPKGRLIIGMNTSLPAVPRLDLGDEFPLEERDWAVVTGEAVVNDLARLAIEAGRIPTRFDRRGRPDPEGKAFLFLDDIHFEPSAFRMSLRIYYRGFPAWWRRFQAKGHFEVDNRQLVMHLDALTPEEGGGAAWAGRFVQRRVMAERSIHALGRIIPSEVPIPGSAEALKPVLKGVGLQSGAIVLMGDIED